MDLDDELQPSADGADDTALVTADDDTESEEN